MFWNKKKKSNWNKVKPIRVVFISPITKKAQLANIVEVNDNYKKVLYDDGIVGWYPLDYPHIWTVKETE